MSDVILSEAMSLFLKEQALDNTQKSDIRVIIGSYGEGDNVTLGSISGTDGTFSGSVTVTGSITVGSFVGCEYLGVTNTAQFGAGIEVQSGDITFSGPTGGTYGFHATISGFISSPSYQDSAGRYSSYLGSTTLSTDALTDMSDNGKIAVVGGTNAVTLTIPDDNSSNTCNLEIINATTGAGSLTLTAASSVIVNGVTAGSVAIPRYARVTLKRIGFDAWSMQIDTGMIKGPFADDSAAATGGVVIGESYYKAAGTVHVRLT